MNDEITTIQEMKDFIHKFIDEREWFQFHSPKNLSISVALESAELMEKFQWCDCKESYLIAEKKRDEVEQELADVIITAICFARSVGIDISSAVKRKMEINGKKYPVEKAKGKSNKYNEL